MLTASETGERGVTQHLVPDLASLREVALREAEDLATLDPAAYRLNKLLLREPIYDAAVRRAEALAASAPTTNPFERLAR